MRSDDTNCARMRPGNILKRYGYYLSSIVVCVLLTQCMTHKEHYNIPANIPPEVRKNYLADLDKGKVLYKTNCSECHGIFTKGKDGVPNFSNQQIDRYSTRFIMRDPKNHAVAVKMNPQQLTEVITYLRCRVTKDSATHVIRPASM